MHTIYAVSSPNTSSVYIGYAGGDLTACTSAFHHKAVRKSSTDRGIHLFMNACGHSLTGLAFEQLDVMASEYEAFLRRNDLRSYTPNSVIGPTAYPGNMYAQAKQYNPEAIRRWDASDKLMKCPTARTAYEMFGERLWKFADVKSSGCTKGDMLSLSPTQFALKFKMSLQLKDVD